MSKTILIMLGAHSFPRAPKLNNDAFLRSHEKVLEYFVQAGTPPENILNLFNDDRESNGQLTAIAEFLKVRPRPARPQNLIVYYVGHGMFVGPDNPYFLAIRRTSEGQEAFSSLQSSLLAHALKQTTGALRRFVILDCCFAGTALAQYMSGAESNLLRKIGDGLPRQGTALLCSSSKDSVSLAPTGQAYTMFSGALIRVLRKLTVRSSIQQVHDAILDDLEVEYGGNFIRPDLHAPAQNEGSVIQIPIFESLLDPCADFMCRACKASFSVHVPRNNFFAFPCPKCVSWIEHNPQANSRPTLGPTMLMYVLQGEREIYPIDSAVGRALTFPVRVKPPGIEAIWTVANSPADFEDLRNHPPALWSILRAKQNGIGKVITEVSEASHLALEILSQRTGHVQHITVPLSMPVIIGRTGGNVIIDDPSVSRVHGWILREGGGLIYEDLFSLSGSIGYYGATARLESISVRQNELIQIGSTLITIRGVTQTLLGRACPLPRQDDCRIAANLKTREPVLTLAGMGLTSLSPAIGTLEHLVRLDLSDNSLTTLPVEIRQLAALQVLNLRRNDLSEVPESLLLLQRLTVLYLHGNARLQLPKEILGAEDDGAFAPNRPHDIIHYCLRLKLGSQKINEGKLMLVGRGGVGKTSIVNRLTRDLYDPNVATTDKIEISIWSERLESSMVKFNIWDFGGQEIMHATHQFFLTERSIYILVVCGREDLQEYDVDYWIGVISSFGGDSPIIIVFNKADAFSSRVGLTSIQKKYPQVSGFVHTECTTGRGIVQLRSAIATAALRMSSIHVEFPNSWFTIKNRIAAMTRPFHSLSDFRKICEEEGETNDERQEELLRHLHNLGIALNYPDEYTVGDTNILNPRWLTEGVYGMLMAPRTRQNSGVFSIRDMRETLPRAAYPPEMHRTLIGIMKKFSICLPLRNDQYLIPDLLRDDQPFLDPDAWNTSCLAFEYKYTMLPEGLMPRFIARTHEMGTDKYRWRSGVVLGNDGCWALVTVDRLSREILIRVQGKRERRALLAVIRREFDQLHREYAKIDFEARVPIPGTSHKTEYNQLRAYEASGRTEMDVFLKDEQRIISVNIRELLEGVDELRPESRPPVIIVHAQEALDCLVNIRHVADSLRKSCDVFVYGFTGASAVAHAEFIQRVPSAAALIWMIGPVLLASPLLSAVDLDRAINVAREAGCQLISVQIVLCPEDSKLHGAHRMLPAKGRPLGEHRDSVRAWKIVRTELQELLKVAL